MVNVKKLPRCISYRNIKFLFYQQLIKTCSGTQSNWLKSVSLLIKAMQTSPFHNLHCHFTVQYCRNSIRVNIDPLAESVRASKH